MSVDMARVGGVPAGGQCFAFVGCRLRDGRRAFAAALFSSYALRRGSVRAARRFMRALSGKFAFHLPVRHQGRADGARAEDRYGEVSGDLPARLLLRRRPLEKTENPAPLVGNKILQTHRRLVLREQSIQAASTPSRHRK